MNKRRLFHLLASVCVILYVFSLAYGNPHLSGEPLTLTNTLVALLFCLAVYYAIQKENILSPLMMMVLYFLFISWTGFNFLFSNPAELTRVAPITPQTLKLTYYLFIAGFLAFIPGYFGVAALSRVSVPAKNPVDSRHTGLPNGMDLRRVELVTLLAVIAMLLLKAYSQYVWHIGIGSVLPKSVPFIGYIFYITKYGPVVGLLLLFRIELAHKNLFYRLMLAGCAATYVILDIIASWKSSPLVLLVTFTVVFVSVKGLPKFKLHVIVPVMLVVLLVYSYASQNRIAFRNNYVDETPQAQPVERVERGLLAKWQGMHWRLIESNRNAVRAVQYCGGKQVLSFSNLIHQNPGAVKFLTNEILGTPKHAVLRRACSLWGNLMIYGGLTGIITGFFLLGVLAKLFFNFIHRREGDIYCVVFKGVFIMWFYKLLMGGLIYRGIKDLIAYAALVVMFKAAHFVFASSRGIG